MSYKSISALKLPQDLISPNLNFPNLAKTTKSQNSLPRHTRVKSNIDSLGSLNTDPLNSDRSLTNNPIQISKQDLTNMFREIKQEILEETVNKNNPYVNEIVSKHAFLDDKVAFTKDEIRQLLRDYKQKIKVDIEHDKEKRMNTENAYYQNMYGMNQQYNNFQSLLWYYYIYNPELYRQLIDEYNHRLHNQLLGSLGLSEQFSNVNKEKEKPLGDGVKFNVSSIDDNTNNDEESSPRSPSKPNIRKSLFIGQNPELLASVVNPQITRKSIYIGDNNNNGNSRKSIYMGDNNNNGNSRKSTYNGEIDRKSTLQNAGKMSILPKEDSENPGRVRKKSVMPSKEQREALKLKDEEEYSKENIMKRNTKYMPVLGVDVLGNNRKSNAPSEIPIQRKSLFPQRKMPSLHINSENKINDNKMAIEMSSNMSSDYDIYGIDDRKESIKKNSMKKKSSVMPPSINFNNYNDNPIKISGARKSNVEEREIIVERYNIRIRKEEYDALKYEDLMSEGLIDFFLKYLQEKQAFLSQKKLANIQLRIFYFPINFYELLAKKPLTIEQINEMYLSKGNSIENFDKILIPLRRNSNDWNYNFILAEMGSRMARYYEIIDETIIENSEILGNVKRFLRELSRKKGDWQLQMGDIEKIAEKKSTALYFCKSVYCISQGIQDLSNREKKTYEFKQKLINLLIKMSRVLEERGEIEDFRVFDL